MLTAFNMGEIVKIQKAECGVTSKSGWRTSSDKEKVKGGILLV
jgi:hypothetical protein